MLSNEHGSSRGNPESLQVVEGGERAGTDSEGGGAKPSSVMSFSSKDLWDAYVPGTVLTTQYT